MGPITAIILAAGDSTRLGTPKQLLTVNGESLLRRTVRAALAAGADRTLVVLGAAADRMREELRELPVEIVDHRAWREGQSSSLRAGLEAAPADTAAALFLVADQPALTPELLRLLVERWREAPGMIVAADYGPAPGTPALFGREFFEELRGLRGDTGARPLLERHRERVVAVPFPGGEGDVDTPPAAVIFDFGNVICSFDVERFVGNLSRATGRTPEQLRATIRSSLGLIHQFESGLVGPEEFMGSIGRTAGFTLAPEEFRRSYCDIFSPIPETLGLIRSLRGRYRLGLLSNTNVLHFECAIRTVDVFELFDAVTLSFEVKAMKPERAIYDDMLAKLALGAGSCVFIDDLAPNVEAAARLGFRAIRYTTHDRLLEDLSRAGVVVDGAAGSERP